MKKLLLILPLFFLLSCNNSESISQNESVTIYPDSAGGGDYGDSVQYRAAAPTGVPYVHWELMSANAERQIGNKPYIFILPLTYKTDNSAKVCIDNIQHSADVLNHTSDTLRNLFPYAVYSWETPYGGVNRNSSWVYVSARLHPLPEIPNIKNWMIAEAKAYHTKGIKIDTSKNPATICKIAWKSSELK